MTLHAIAILVSSFLLLLVQPIVARQLLPAFGGTVAAWTTCLVFFQATLLAGYAYADAGTRLGPLMQKRLHAVLLLSSLFFLPITLTPGVDAAAGAQPAWRILTLLASTVGFPCFMVAANSPLIQSWFALEQTDPSLANRTYRLFSLSNLSSLIALVSYPFVIEPALSVREQVLLWTAGYVVFILLCLGIALRPSQQAALAATPASASERDGLSINDEPRLLERVKWFTLSALASWQLVAVSTHLSQNIASVPFLWVLPLSLYLLSFTLVFGAVGGKGLYHRSLWLAPTLASLFIMSWGLTAQGGAPQPRHGIPLFCGSLFVICMFCHGELATSRPKAKHLTRFYLTLSAGGAAGGLLVSLLAPTIFTDYWELPIGASIGALAVAAVTRRSSAFLGVRWSPLLAVVTAILCAFYGWKYRIFMGEQTILATRNFYGAMRVTQDSPDGTPWGSRSLVHGLITHGSQPIRPEDRQFAGTYYGRNSGIGLAMARTSPSPRRVGVVGLGIGTLAVYARPGDVFHFYEINPEVVEIANRYFHYLKDSAAKIEITMGDGRASLNRQASQRFDVLAADAFSGDGVPVHLLTREAVKVYRKHMNPGGILAINVSNRYLNLAPLVKALGDEEGLEAILIDDRQPTLRHVLSSTWVLLTDDRAFIDHPVIRARRSGIVPIPGLKPWTDDFSNMFQLLR